MDVLRRTIWRRFAAMLALVGILLQASFSVVHASAVNANLLGSDFGQSASGVIVICTPSGLKSIRIDGSDSTNQAPLSSPHEICPICLTVAAGSAALGAGTVSEPVFYHQQVQHLPEHRIVVPGAICLSACQRGPPLSA